MNTDITMHKVKAIELTTKSSGLSSWVCIRAIGTDGKYIDLTFFAEEAKAITLKLGEEE